MCLSASGTVLHNNKSNANRIVWTDKDYTFYCEEEAYAAAEMPAGVNKADLIQMTYSEYQIKRQKEVKVWVLTVKENEKITSCQYVCHAYEDPKPLVGNKPGTLECISRRLLTARQHRMKLIKVIKNEDGTLRKLEEGEDEAQAIVMSAGQFYSQVQDQKRVQRRQEAKAAGTYVPGVSHSTGINPFVAVRLEDDKIVDQHEEKAFLEEKYDDKTRYKVMRLVNHRRYQPKVQNKEGKLITQAAFKRDEKDRVYFDKEGNEIKVDNPAQLPEGATSISKRAMEARKKNEAKKEKHKEEKLKEHIAKLKKLKAEGKKIPPSRQTLFYDAKGDLIKNPDLDSLPPGATYQTVNSKKQTERSRKQKAAAASAAVEEIAADDDQTKGKLRKRKLNDVEEKNATSEDAQRYKPRRGGAKPREEVGPSSVKVESQAASGAAAAMPLAVVSETKKLVPRKEMLMPVDPQMVVDEAKKHAINYALQDKVLPAENHATFATVKDKPFFASHYYPAFVQRFQAMAVCLQKNAVNKAVKRAETDVARYPIAQEEAYIFTSEGGQFGIYSDVYKAKYLEEFHRLKTQMAIAEGSKQGEKDACRFKSIIPAKKIIADIAKVEFGDQYLLVLLQAYEKAFELKVALRAADIKAKKARDQANQIIQSYKAKGLPDDTVFLGDSARNLQDDFKKILGLTYIEESKEYKTQKNNLCIVQSADLGERGLFLLEAVHFAPNAKDHERIICEYAGLDTSAPDYKSDVSSPFYKLDYEVNIKGKNTNKRVDAANATNGGAISNHADDSLCEYVTIGKRVYIVAKAGVRMIPAGTEVTCTYAVRPANYVPLKRNLYDIYKPTVVPPVLYQAPSTGMLLAQQMSKTFAAVGGYAGGNGGQQNAAGQNAKAAVVQQKR